MGMRARSVIMAASDFSKLGITRRDLGVWVAGALAAAAPASVSAQIPALPANSGAALDIAEWTYYYFGVEHATLARGTICNGMQMYVEHWIPGQVRRPYPVVLIHGGYGQGSDWISTPDGRRGWVSLLLEQGYKVYVLDRPGQGRNPYHPFSHGMFDRQAQTFEGVARNLRGTAILHTQWPGTGDANDPAVVQVTAALGQPIANNAVTRSVWGARGRMLLDEIGSSILITHGDGAVFAWVTAQERPKLVKGIAVIEQTPQSLRGLSQDGLAQLAGIPIAMVSAEASSSNSTGSAIADTLRQAGCVVEQVRLAEHGVRGNGPMLMMEKNNREALGPLLSWMDSSVYQGAPAVVAAGLDPNRNIESTGLKLADQGCFWVGVRRKSMPYGAIPEGQMYVQYMIPAEKRRPYPVVLVHGGGGQGCHMMGIGGRPGWVHYFVQAGYSVYWLDRPSFGRSPYHPDALGPSHLTFAPPYEGLIESTGVFNTAQWPGAGGMHDPLIDQFMANEIGRVLDEAYHTDLVWRGGVELLDRIGPCILVVHAFGGFFAWGVADQRPNLVKAIMCMETNGDPFAGAFRWGLSAGPITYDPPVTDPSQFKLAEHTEPPDSPRPAPLTYKLQAEPAHKWKNLQNIPIGWLTSEFGAGGSPVANLAFLKQVGCQAEMLRLRDYGILGNGNLMLLEKNNHEVFAVIRDWLDKKLPEGRV
jgi:pimeloyl-ACP methyl ester carboxylesterase